MLTIQQLAKLRVNGHNKYAESPTLGDLIAAIRADQGISTHEKLQLIQQLQISTAGATNQTPLSALMHGVLGGIIGTLISRYFGMGSVGQMLSAVSGFGIGKVLSDHLSGSSNGWIRM